jgi:hypothetical protein
MRNKLLATGAILLTVLLAGQEPVMASKKAPAQTVPDSTILNGSIAGPFDSLTNQSIDPTTGLLLWQLSHKPELMNVDYLRYYLGPPDRLNGQVGATTKIFNWYDKARHLTTELYQELENNQVTQSMMIFHLPPSKLDFKLMEKTLGQPQRQYFDQTASPTKMYSYRQNTTLAMTTPANAFYVATAKITYIGSPLPNPSVEDLQLAHDSYMQRARGTSFAVDKRGAKVNWAENLDLARSQVQEHPNDPAAHAYLAEALKKTGNVHAAIGEYKTALFMSKYDDATQQQCIQGLKDLYVLPKDYGATGVAGSQPMQFSNGGQTF